MLINFLTHLSIFIAVFSFIATFKLVANFISVLLSNPPRQFLIRERALIAHGLLLSYLITFIIYLIL